MLLPNQMKHVKLKNCTNSIAFMNIFSHFPDFKNLIWKVLLTEVCTSPMFMRNTVFDHRSTVSYFLWYIYRGKLYISIEIIHTQVIRNLYYLARLFPILVSPFLKIWRYLAWVYSRTFREDFALHVHVCYWLRIYLRILFWSIAVWRICLEKKT